MMTDSSFVRLVFLNDFSDIAALEAKSRGYLSHVLVEIEEARRYPVFFYDIVRLQQDLVESTKHGAPFIADPGMIVLPELSLSAMEEAVKQLSRNGFFQHLVPIDPDQMAKTSPYQWPPTRCNAGEGAQDETR